VRADERRGTLAARPALMRQYKLTTPPRVISDIAHLALPRTTGAPVRLKGADVRAVDLEDVLEKLEADGHVEASVGLSKADRILAGRLAIASRTDPDLTGVSVALKRTRTGTRLVMSLATDADVERAAAAVARALKPRS